MPNDKRIRAALITGAIALSIILTGTAFWLSYAHLAGIAGQHGVNAIERQWAWPATVDMFIAVGEIILSVAIMTKSNAWPAIALTTVGSGGSIAVNLAGVGPARPVLDYVTAAVPPVASTLAFGAIMWQVHTFLHRLPNTPEHPPTSSDPVQTEQPNTAEQAAPNTPEQPNTDPYDGLISGKELALQLGKSAATVRGYVMNGKLTPAAVHPTRGNLFHPDQRPAA